MSEGYQVIGPLTEYVTAFRALARNRDDDTLTAEEFDALLEPLIHDIEASGMRRYFFEELAEHDPADRYSVRHNLTKYRRRGPPER